MNALRAAADRMRESRHDGTHHPREESNQMGIIFTRSSIPLKDFPQVILHNQSIAAKNSKRTGRMRTVVFNISLNAFSRL